MPDTSKVMDIIVQFKDRASQAIKKMQGQMGLLGRAARVAGNSLSTLQSRVIYLKEAMLSLHGALVGLGIGLTAKSFLDTAASFEAMQIKLDALTKGRGVETLEEINKWALEMPVNTQKAVETFSMMQAMGLDPTIEKMQTLVDVSVLFGEDTMPRVARSLGQMITLGKLSSEELNQMAEAGINARKYITAAFGKTVEEVQKAQIPIEQVVDAIWKGLDADYAGSAQKAQRSWQGLWTTFLSYITEIQRQIMKAGVFDALKDAIMEVNSFLQAWIKNNQELIKTKVPEYVEKIKNAIIKIWEVVNYDPDILKFGVFGLVLFGKKGAVVFGALAHMKNVLENTAKGFGAWSQGLITWSDLAHANFKELEQMLEGADTALKNLGGPKTFKIDVQALDEQLYGKIEDDLDFFLKEMDKAKPKAQKAAKALSPVDALASEMSRFKQMQQTTLAYLEGYYKDGVVDFEQYWGERRRIQYDNFQKEKAVLEAQIKETAAILKKDPKKDPKALLALNDQLFALEEQHKRDLLQLDKDEAASKKKIAEDQASVEKTLADARLRAATGGDQGLTAQFQKELQDLQTRQDAEIQSLTDHNANIEQLNDARRAHELEKEKLLADQKKRFQDEVLSNAQKSLGFMEQAFGNMYEATGKKHKSWARAQRATQIAMTVISTYQSAVEAYKAALTIPVVGMYLAPIAAAAAIVAGMAQVAAMRAQPLATGGEVKGRSPSTTADNIPVMATAGEFVQPVSSVRKYGIGVMEAIRTGSIPPAVLAGYNLRGFQVPRGYRLAEGGSIPSVPEATAGGGGAAAQPVNIINILDPNEFDQYLWSPQGQDSIVNIVSSNQDKLRRLRE